MQKKFIYLFLIFACISNSSCLPFVIGGASTGVVMSSGERSIKEVKDDIFIFTSIKNQYIQYNSKDLFQHVNVKVMNGSVLLTGNVRNSKTKMLAEKIAWIPENVKEVINEINIDDYSGIRDYASDLFIQNHIRARLLLEKGVKIANYKYHVINSNVYVIGVTSSDEELRRVLDLISHISGVKKVINYVKLINSY